MKEKFNETYYSSGNYNNYLERKFDEQADNIINIFNLEKNDKILDYGCALGGLLNALKEKGYENLTGTDISFWAIESGKQKYNLNLQHYNRNLLTENWDVIILLDVLEHVNTEELDKIILLLSRIEIAKGIIIRLPVSKNESEDFVLECSKKDKTHIQCHCKEWWKTKFKEYNFNIDQVITMDTMYESEGVLVRVLKKI